MSIKSVSLLCLLALLLGSPALAARDRVDDFITREMDKGRIPGVAVAILKDGELIKLGTYGHANVEHLVSVTPHTLFQSASVGKQFTAAAVQLLAREGKLGLDDPVSRHIPAVPPTWKDMTIRHLLSHTSGLGSYPENFDWRRTWSENQLVDFVRTQPLAFQPGSDWRYSNLGYVLLGAIIRSVSGQFYGDFLEERVFGPAGMTTAQVMDEAAVTPNRAAGYRLDDGALKNQRWVSPSLNTTADGALYVSITDLAAWERALHRASILNESELTEAWKKSRLTDRATRPYGLGWTLAEENGNQIVEHSGHWQGFSSHILRYPRRGVSVILLANMADVTTAVFARSLAGLIDPSLAAPPRSYVDLPVSALREYAGRYALSPTMMLEIFAKDGALFGQSPGQDPLRLKAEAKDRFFIEEISAPLLFFRDSRGVITHLVLEQGGSHRAEKLK